MSYEITYDFQNIAYKPSTRRKNVKKKCFMTICSILCIIVAYFLCSIAQMEIITLMTEEEQLLDGIKRGDSIASVIKTFIGEYIS